MKKIYLSPAIETLEVRATFAICGGSPQDPDLNGGGITPAPGRKPF